MQGLVAVHGDPLKAHFDPNFLLRADAPVKGKVAIVSGGGSGHEPMHGGFVGKGMLDAACPGAVFTSPTPDQMHEATKAVNGGKGVLHIDKNYTGDVLNFELGEVEMEMGVGIHGEPGRQRLKIADADAITEMLLKPIIEDIPFKSGDNVLLFVNSMGGTPAIELYVVYRKAHEMLTKAGIKVTRNLVGPYITSLEMAGTSITVLKLDDQLTKLWDAPVHTPALRSGA